MALGRLAVCPRERVAMSMKLQGVTFGYGEPMRSPLDVFLRCVTRLGVHTFRSAQLRALVIPPRQGRESMPQLSSFCAQRVRKFAVRPDE